MPDAAGGTSLSSDINPFENMQYRALENNLDELDKHVLAVISALSAPANVDLKPGQISPNPSVGAAAIGAGASGPSESRPRSFEEVLADFLTAQTERSSIMGDFNNALMKKGNPENKPDYDKYDKKKAVEELAGNILGVLSGLNGTDSGESENESEGGSGSESDSGSSSGSSSSSSSSGSYTSEEENGVPSKFEAYLETFVKKWDEIASRAKVRDMSDAQNAIRKKVNAWLENFFNPKS